jgi:superfamily II DNA or RNA helicase
MLPFFSNYWEGRYIDGVVVSSIPEKVRRDLINAEIQYGEENVKNHTSKAYLRPYQLRAIEYWKEHNYIGGLEMATGTGKTFTALECIKELFKKVGRKPIVIAVLTMEIARQWLDGWMAFFGKYPILYRSKNKEKYRISEYASIFGNEAVIIATYNFLSGTYFHKEVLPLIGNNAVLIADEMHHLGAPTFRRLIKMPYQFRLGLSATPHRLFDCEGMRR